MRHNALSAAIGPIYHTTTVVMVHQSKAVQHRWAWFIPRSLILEDLLRWRWCNSYLPKRLSAYPRTRNLNFRRNK